METDLETQINQTEEKLAKLKQQQEELVEKKRKLIEDSKIELTDEVSQYRKGKISYTNPLRLGKSDIPTDTVIVLEEGLSIHCHSYELMKASKYFLDRLKNRSKTIKKTVRISKSAEFSPVVFVQWLECMYNDDWDLHETYIYFPEVCLKTLKYFEASCLEETIKKMVNVYVSKGHFHMRSDYTDCDYFEFNSDEREKKYRELVKKIRSVGLDVPPLPSSR